MPPNNNVSWRETLPSRQSATTLSAKKSASAADTPREKSSISPESSMGACVREPTRGGENLKRNREGPDERCVDANPSPKRARRFVHAEHPILLYSFTSFCTRFPSPSRSPPKCVHRFSSASRFCRSPAHETTSPLGPMSRTESRQNSGRQSKQAVTAATSSPSIEAYQSVDALEAHGVSATDIKKLREAGIVTCLGVLQRPRRHLLDIKGLSEAKLDKILAAAKAADGGVQYRTGAERAAERQRVIRVSTGSRALDALIGGGIESSAITEVYGEFRCGKTQLCHTVAVTAQAAESEAAGRVIYIDTEGNFRPERIRSIAEHHGLDADDVLENIAHARAYTTDQQLELLREAATLMCEARYALCIVDSATSLYRVDYSGRGELSARQQHLNQFMSGLVKMAEEFNVAALITNQVQACPDGAAAMFVANPMKPIGGHVMAHASTTRVCLRKGRAEQRIAKLVDSPALPEAETTFEIGVGGVVDVTE
eukprot:ctg_302.g128